MKKIMFISLLLIVPALSAEDNDVHIDGNDTTIPNNEIVLDHTAGANSVIEKNIATEEIEDQTILRQSNAKISCNKILPYAKQFAAYYYAPTTNKLSKDNSSTDSLDQTITNVCSQLVSQLNKNNLTFIDKKHLDFILNTALSKLLPDTLLSTFSQRLAEQLDIGIAQFFKDKGIDTKLIPADMRDEFKNHRNDALKNLRQLMIKHHRNNATQEEIATAVHNAFESFAETIPHVLLWNLIKAETKTVGKGKDATSSIAINPETFKLREQLEALTKKEIRCNDDAKPVLTSILKDGQQEHLLQLK